MELLPNNSALFSFQSLWGEDFLMAKVGVASPWKGLLLFMPCLRKKKRREKKKQERKEKSRAAKVVWLGVA